MMKTSSSSSRSSKHFLSLFMVVLVPWGPVDALLKDRASYQAFRADDPVLEVLDIKRFKTKDLKHCQVELKKVEKYHPGNSLESLQATFMPWSPEDIEAVAGCDRFPCDIKFNLKEGSRVMELPAEDRKSEWEKIVRERLALYLESGVRKEYLYVAEPMDPFKRFQKMGFSISEGALKKPGILVRKLQLSDRKMRPLRQVLDVKTEASPNSVKVWVRDVYTAHYFDSWGELHQADCDAEGNLTLIQALALDFDLLKKTDFFSSISKGKMRSAIEENGHKYLVRVRDDLKIEEIKKPK